MRVGIDLLWVRPQKCGGTEAVIRNLLDGFTEFDHKNVYYLFTTEDNHDSFLSYKNAKNMKLVRCSTISESPIKRLIWENLFLDRTAQKHNIDVMFIPVYSKPWSFVSKIPYIVNIADLQAWHYPQYFSFAMNCYMRYIWWYACATSKRVVTVSDWCKEDIEKYYPFAKGRVCRIYNPIITVKKENNFDNLREKYGIEKNEYYYCVSSMLPHKNLETLIYVMAELQKHGCKKKLLISGVGGHADELNDLCSKLNVQDMVIDTGFVSNEDRDCLYDNCALFLFPSCFEGFGMPPIEAMRRGKKVLMTKETCLYEVTEGKAYYVEDPLNAEEWVERIQAVENANEEVKPFEQYDVETICKKYMDLWIEISVIQQNRDGNL